MLPFLVGMRSKAALIRSLTGKMHGSTKARPTSLERRARQLDKQIKVAYAPILDLMGAACNAVCETPMASYQISYNPQYQEEMTKAQLELLRAQHPDIYHDFVDTTEKRVFKISKEVK